MKLHQLVTGNYSSFILYVIIQLANIDYMGIIDYALKAIIGSAIWFGFKVLADRYSQKHKKQITKRKEL